MEGILMVLGKGGHNYKRELRNKERFCCLEKEMTAWYLRFPETHVV